MKVLLDTSLYIDFLRAGAFSRDIEGIYTFRRAFIHFSSVVIEELLQGVSNDKEKKLVETLYCPFEQAGRIITPTHVNWKEAGDIIAKLKLRRKDLKIKLPGLVNDTLIAMSARSTGAMVYTANKKDFELIASVRKFHYKVITA